IRGVIMAGLVPAIPIERARSCPPKRDRRDKPGDDEGNGIATKQCSLTGKCSSRLVATTVDDLVSRVLFQDTSQTPRLLRPILRGGNLISDASAPEAR